MKAALGGMEIRCEAMLEHVPGPRGTKRPNHCWSQVNTGPMGYARDTHVGVLKVLRALEREARKTGWVKLKSGWVCPVCAKQVAKQPQ